MAKRALYGNRIEKACEVCLHGRRAADGQSVLCKYKGVVPLNYRCRKYEYDPLRRIPSRPMILKQHTAEEFSLD